MKRILMSVLFATVCNVALAQNGFLRGKIIDQSTGEGLFGATITKQGTIQGAVGDFDGNFSLNLEEGTHTVVVQFISYQTKTIEGVEIVAGEVTNLDVMIAEDSEQLEEVVVTAEQIRDNEVALLSVQKKSANTVDGISAAAFKKIGDSNLSGAMKRVTGVTVQGGKYVYVRGLGDRYTKTTLNGMVIPGLDPDRNDVQIDIFPTAILENVMVYKTFSPDLNGDFAGGLLDVQTKSFPDQKETSVSFSLGYNPSMHFQSESVSYDGSATDWLGFDNGQREVPFDKNFEIPILPNTDENLETLSTSTRDFNSDLGVTRARNFMDYGLSVSHRDQKSGEVWTLGYNVILSYKVRNSYYNDFERNQYIIDKTADPLVISSDYSSTGAYGSTNTLWSGLGSVAIKRDNHMISLNLLHTQNGVSSSVNRLVERSSLNNPGTFYNDILSYTERGMSNAVLSGKHQLGGLNVSWSNSFFLTKMHDLDYRNTNINTENDQLDFKNGGGINRFWRYLDEMSETFKLDLAYDLSDNNKLKLGGQVAYRNRTFDVVSYNYEPQNSFKPTSSDANDLLLEENLISEDNLSGLRISDNNNDFNEYEGNQIITAGYIMNDWKLTESFRAIYGVRVEQTNMDYTGNYRDIVTGSTERYDKEQTLDELNFLPSVSLVYSLTEEMNFRGSFNQTIARPSFKEKSSAFIDDPINRQIFSGNIDLKMTEINNYDLRWEYFFTASEMISVSAFYKDFTNHIALAASPLRVEQVTPRNVGSAQVFGAEFEIRKSMAMISPSLEDFSVGMNLSLVKSQVDRKTVIVNKDTDGTDISEYDAEVDFRGTDEGVEQYRTMTGQSPYALNVFLNYDNNRLGINGNIAYNVQGESLAIIGVASSPEVYTLPFNSLNMKVSKVLGAQQKSSIYVAAKNILNDDVELQYRFDGDSQVFSKYSPGTRIDIGYTYSF